MMHPIALYLRDFRAETTNPPPRVAEVAPADSGAVDWDDAAPFALPAPDLDGAGGEEPDFAPAPFAEHEAPAADADQPEPAPDLASVVEALQADHAQALSKARDKWATEEGAVFASRLGEAFTTLETRVCDLLAPLLEPFLAQAAQAKVIDQLRGSLDTLLGSADSVITIEGPADLLAAIRQHAPDRASLRFTESDRPDVVIAMGDTRIRSQLQGWAAKLESALGVPA